MQRILNFTKSAAWFLVVAAGLVAWLKVPQLVLGAMILFSIWLLISRPGRQSLAIVRTSLATLSQRLGATSVIVVGIAGVVGVMVALLAMAGGFEATLHQTGNEDTAIVLRAGANTELSSGLDRTSITLIGQAAGVLHDAQDRPLASAEVVVVVNLPKRSTGTDANVELRGVGAQAWALRSNLHIIQGRAFQPGLRELVVGKGALQQFALELGSTISLANQSWTVVGVFDSGDAHNSELWGDAESVAAAYRRGDVHQSVTVQLVDATAFDKFKAALAADPRLKIDVETTRSYYNKQSEKLTSMIRILGTGVAVIMAIGAVFGALNTMYAAVAARGREIATLRALGFTEVPVLVSVLLEAMILAALGGGLGAAIAYGFFNGYSVSTLGANFSQVVFQFKVDSALLLQGMQWSLAIGFVGGLFPALRAAKIPITTALREM